MKNDTMSLKARINNYAKACGIRPQAVLQTLMFERFLRHWWPGGRGERAGNLMYNVYNVGFSARLARVYGGIIAPKAR